MPSLDVLSPALGSSPVGTHVKVGRGLVEEAVPRARRIGAEVLQVFTGNPRGWAPARTDPAKPQPTIR